MILASGARGREFDSRNTPLLEIFWSFFIYGCRNHLKWAKWAATRSQYWPCISLKIFESFCLKSPSSIWTVIFTPSPQKPPSSSDFLGFWRPNHLLQSPLSRFLSLNSCEHEQIRPASGSQEVSSLSLLQISAGHSLFDFLFLFIYFLIFITCI